MIKVILLMAFAIVLGLWLWRMYQSNQRRIMKQRRQLLEQCIDLLDAPVLTTCPAGFARLAGRFQGYSVKLMLEDDHVAVRKIPSLWLHVQAEGEHESEGTLDMLMRPQNIEFYSPGWQWDGVVTPLASWPVHALYRTKDYPPNLLVMDDSVQRVFRDDKAKELVVTPHLARLTWQAKQAERGAYLLLRSVHFDAAPIPKSDVLELLQRATEIRRNLEGLRSS